MFKCTGCGQSFTRADNVLRHRRERCCRQELDHPSTSGMLNRYYVHVLINVVLFPQTPLWRFRWQLVKDHRRRNDKESTPLVLVSIPFVAFKVG